MRKRYSMDLGAHMAECDANYARLCALAPSLCGPAEGQIGFDPAIASADSCEFALDIPGNQVELLVELVERSRYTTLVRFTQLGNGGQQVSRLSSESSRESSGANATNGNQNAGEITVAGVALNLAPPTMSIRLYHDARSAEVVEVRNESRFKEVYEYPNPRMRARDEKAQVNRFLGEYLAMCLRYGLTTEQVAVGH